MTVPALHREDIAAQAQLAFARERKHFCIAIYGTGDADTLPNETVGAIRVLPVESELDLRMRLLELPEATTPAVFLVPFRGQVPMDLASRFALEGTVQLIGRYARLKRMFGVREVSDAAARSPLTDYLLSLPEPPTLPVGSPELTEPEMWQAWLGRQWGLETDGGLSLDSFLAWAAVQEPGGHRTELLDSHPELLEGLLAFLRRSLGPAGPAVLQAWRMRAGGLVLEYALLFEAVRASEDPEAGLWVRLRVKDKLGVVEDDERRQVASQLAEAVNTALPLYTRAAAQDSKAPERTLYERAEALADDESVKRALVGSARLPSGWRLRLHALGRALSQLADAPSRAAFTEVLAAKAQLERHANFRDEGSARVAERAEMATRLAGWLVSDRSDLAAGAAEPSHKDVERLGRWYAEEGGFVDLARGAARGGTSDEFDLGVVAVVRQADRIREELDLRFARAAAAWTQGAPGAEVIPIDQVTKRVVAPYLKDHDDRRILILLLDGMAWAQAIEILLSLGEQAEGWGVAAWHAQARQHKLGSARTPVVIAGFPTVTEISRSAFFAGKPMPKGKPQKTSDDPVRFRDNAALRPFFEGAEYPRLFLRGEGHTAHGSASKEALAAIAQSDHRVVGVVINAIDASLKGDRQERHPWKVDNVLSLPEFLTAAKDHGRTVLLASDHGHVPADCFEASAGQATDGARWRRLTAASDPVEPYEVKLAGERVWCPKGAEAVALLADDRHRYGGGAHAGEHGGATLAEVIAPCLLIHWDDQVIRAHDPERAPQALPQPAWWHFDITEPLSPEAPSAPITPKPRKSKATVPDNQLSLDHVPLPEPAAPEPPGKAPANTTIKQQSPAAIALGSLPQVKNLSAKERRQLLEGVDYLLARDGIATTAAFAAHVGLLEGRTRGFVARYMQPVLNVDGFQIIGYEGGQIRLDVAVLKAQFGVES
ncbi:MAG: BREX-2 system phosphatase PglZ [Myxococcales bacterium]|nr:BREX-2 system phosphatase PglZ [Myxococcales bacterium]